jgi:hypothetical protein
MKLAFTRFYFALQSSKFTLEMSIRHRLARIQKSLQAGAACPRHCMHDYVHLLQCNFRPPQSGRIIAA